MSVLSPNPSPSEIADRWHSDGWVVVPAVLSEEETRQGRQDLQRQYPDPASVWREPDPELKAEQFAGITEFPYTSAALNQLALNESIAKIAAMLLGHERVSLYMSHAWAKYTGSADYDQSLHRDFRSHTFVVPDQQRLEYAQVEMMLYLSDVDEDCGPTHLVSRQHTVDLPLHPEFLPRQQYHHLYDKEQSAAAPAGSLLIYAPDVVHRGTNLTRPAGSRFVLAIGYQRPGNTWMGYHSWPRTANRPEFAELVNAASARQLALLGFPEPADPYWNPATIAGVKDRYPLAAFDTYLKRA